MATEVVSLAKRATSRKFILGLILAGIATLLLGLGNIEFNDWAEFMKWVFGIYVVGNVSSSVTQTIVNRDI